ncbi:MAG TPA: CBS domain-containing protein [Actinomycetes bacterium]|jgi:CBS domain-containing protein|nr:CBS domain-containing protein [Actinomycetes bacterium]
MEVIAEMRVSERCRRVLLVTLPEETLLTAATRMRRYDVSALPVYRGQRLVGIITERDLVTAIADRADLAATRVADYMTDEPSTTQLEEDVEVAAQRMAELGVRHLPVVDGGRLVGVLSMRDLLTPARAPALRA